MVIKDNLLHTGWSYGNGDDQYDNESIGSTKNVFEIKKSMENSRRNEQNDQNGQVCSNNNKYHDEQGWTTIEANSSRKPKSETSNQIAIDSIITTINVDFNKVAKGAPEAKIDSPIRKNRCTIPDEKSNQQANEFNPKYNSNQKLISTTVEETEGNTADQFSTQETNKNKSYVQDIKRVSFRDDRKGNKVNGNERMDATKWREEKGNTTAISEEKGNKEIGFTTMATNGPSEVNQIESGNGANEKNNGNNQKQNENQSADKDMTTTNNTGDNSQKKNNGGNNRSRVTVMTPSEMATYAFTISWRPDQKVGQDGKIIIKMLMREMAHRTPSIVFHPTNSATSPVPKDINNINNDFPTTPASFDDFFDVMRNRENTNQRTFMKVTMPHDEKELQKKLSNYLFYNKLYMNSPFIDDNTLEHVGFIENGHSRMVYRPNLERKIREGLNEVMKGDALTPQQTAQLKHLSSPIRVECHRGTVRAGPNHQQVVCEGIVLKTAKSQSKIAMELLSMLPETLLGNHYRIIPKSLNNLLGYEIYGQIVQDTVNFQDKLRPITIMYCHPSVFEDMYDCVKVQNSTHVEVYRFIIENCGAISIEETSETKDKGKYIVVVPEDKVDSARTAIGKMFQEFQQNNGRKTALSCLTAYQNYPLVNDNVTISGHAQRLSEKIRSRYLNRPKTPMKNHSSSTSYSYHGSTTQGHEQRPTNTQTPAVPRSIIKNNRYTNNAMNGGASQWQGSPTAQRRQTAPTQHVEDRTVMSNLSPDDSAKTMMTNVSRMVETLGNTVNTLAKESANTNDTMKNMMMQQTATMNNLMMLMTRNEERRQEIPVNIIQQPTSTQANSTITNSQNSLSQQSNNNNKRKSIGGSKDDETITTSTTAPTNEEEMEDNIEDMLQEQEEAFNEMETQQQNTDNNDSNDIIMADNEQTMTSTTPDGITNTPNAAGDFETQFKTKANNNQNVSDHDPALGANRQ
jgi:hypothetical protein